MSLVVAVLAGVGGMAAGAALVAMLLVLPGAAPGSTPGDSVGEPLDDVLGLAGNAGMVRLAAAPADTVKPTELLVDVAGAVLQPGLHRLRPGDRVGDAIEAAGGYAPRADLGAASRSLNLAQLLEDGAKVLVPTLGVDDAAPAVAGPGRIDLNRADRAELETLPGIGPVTAGKIIAARAERSFSAVRDLRGRAIVGPSVFESLKDLVTVSR